MRDACSVQSQRLGEPIAGTAKAGVSVWIVLEHRGPWGYDAVLESDLPDAVKQRLAAWSEAIGGVRVQLVRRSVRLKEPRRLWIATADLERPRLWSWSLSAVEDVLALDAPAIVAALRRGEPIEGAREHSEPMVLVCTNGRRDVCCSKRGIAVVQALARATSLDVWQTTHLGGHRFAATLVQLPAGLCYGRVEPEEAQALAVAIERGEVHRASERLRGRMALAAPEQAAEVIWRARGGPRAIDALRHTEHEVRGDRVVVTLRDRDGNDHAIAVQRRTLGVMAPPSCGEPAEPIAGWYPVEPVTP